MTRRKSERKEVVAAGTPVPVPDLSRPSIEVRVAPVQLQMSDLAYLRSLTQPKSLRCHPGHKTLDKLRFLDLIARAKVQPDAYLMAEFVTKSKVGAGKVADAARRKDWKGVHGAAHELYRMTVPEATEEDVLTEKGKALLAEGNVMVRVRKVGCVE